MTPEQLQDTLTRHQVLLEGVKEQESNNLLLIIPVLFDIIRQEIGASSVQRLSELSPTQLTRLINRITDRLNATHEPYRRRIINALNELVLLELEEASRITDTDPPEQATAKAIWATPMGHDGSLPTAFIAAWFASFVLRLQNTLRKAWVDNTTNTALIQNIRGTRANNFKDGLLGGQTARTIKTTVNTSMQHFFMASQLEVFKNNSSFKGYQWMSILDNRTSAICRSLDGRVFKFGEGPIPPAHPNCRSSIAPVKHGEDPRKSRETYYEWLKRQSASFQDEVLGVSRGKLFRSGKLTVEQFSRLQLDKNFRPRTLGELRRLLPANR